MASFVTRITDALTRVATECKAIRTMVNGNLADLSSLATTSKASLVAAVNEVRALAQDAAENGGATINDSLAASTAQTWSISKIGTEIEEAAAAVRQAILGGVGPAYDTLQELVEFLESQGADLSAVLTAVANRVRFDTAAQGLTVQQQANARTNIGAIAADAIGNPDTDFVAVFEGGLA